MDEFQLYDAYYKKDYKNFLKLFDSYLEKGYGLDLQLVNTYIIVLERLNKYDKAYSITKKVEKEMIKHGFISSVLQSYIHCFKPKEAERTIEENKSLSIDSMTLIELYLLEGKIKEAKIEIKKIRNNIIDDKQKEKLNKFKKIIYNNEYKNAFIETEYSCFLKNGNKLEVGHIVFLKNAPDIDYKASFDDRIIDRPYMIWKIDGDKISLFPVSGVCKSKYKLYHQKYPNSIGDRVIKNNSCNSRIDNILSVKDKVLDEDLKIILRAIYESLYFGYSQYKHLNKNKEFIRSYIKKPDCYDVIETINSDNNKHHFYIVLEMTKDDYNIIEIDFINKKIIGTVQESIKKDTMLYNVIETDEKFKYDLREQLKKIEFSKSKKMNFVGKKANVDGENIIVIAEDKENCFCIFELYSSSYITPFIIDKKRIRKITGDIPTEELEHIKEILRHNEINIQNRLKLEKKKK